MHWIETLGLVGSIVLPFWNIPLIRKMIRRKSSQDISVSWALGVWFCALMMFPAGLRSADVVWRTYNIVNFALFSLVVITVLYYREKK